MTATGSSLPPTACRTAGYRPQLVEVAALAVQRLSSSQTGDLGRAIPLHEQSSAVDLAAE